MEDLNRRCGLETNGLDLHRRCGLEGDGHTQWRHHGRESYEEVSESPHLQREGSLSNSSRSATFVGWRDDNVEVVFSDLVLKVQRRASLNK